MRKHLAFALFIVLGIFALSADRLAAGTPVRVDVQSMSILFQRSSGEPYYRVYAVDEMGTPVTFGGWGNYVLDFTNGEPFSIPNTFSTDRFDTFSMTFGLVNSYGQFTVFSGHSDPLRLWPTNTPRKSATFSRTGNVGFHASFHYSTELGYEAFDDDVVLEGNYQVDLVPVNWLSGRKIQYTRLYFDLKKPVDLSAKPRD
ncbi:MAG: hypothetical protein ABIP75_03240 [Pyrinomonadaceae bacterium]